MVKHVTQILKEEGYDYSYIHFTGVAPWYEKLGYKTSVQWTKNGVVQQMIFSKWDYVRLGYSEVKKKSAITCEWSL